MFFSIPAWIVVILEPVDQRAKFSLDSMLSYIDALIERAETSRDQTVDRKV